VPAHYECWREVHAKSVKIFPAREIIDLPHAGLDGARQQMLLGPAAERNTKHQTPNSREVPNLKYQTHGCRGQRHEGRFLSLMLGASLDFGVWNLELLARALALTKGALTKGWPTKPRLCNLTHK
jgi:hypothetical protein